jgi:hypothetical protein
LIEILLQQRIVRFGDQFDDALASLVDDVAAFGRDRDLFSFALLIELVGFHVHDVDHAFEVVFFSDWQGEGNDCSFENVVRAIERDADIRMLFI